MGITATFTEPFYGGSGASSSLVPSQFPAAVNGRPYMLDIKSGEWKHASIKFLRQQSDDGTSPAESSINPESMWRRAQDSWHHGAGQTFRDREGGDEFRFRSSKGIDVWTRYQMSLLPATDQKETSSDTNLKLVVAGSRIYYVEATALKFTDDITADSPTWTTVTGTTGVTITGIATDGFNVWVTDGANIYVTNTGVSTASAWSTEDADLIDYVKGRLMATDANEILYASDIATPTFTSLFTHNSTGFTWVGFAEGQNHIYAAGYSGDKSYIYRTAVVAEGVNLGAPTIAGQLPDGEIIRSIYGYLGFIFLGTDSGVRFCTADDNGSLIIGALIDIGVAVRCFEGQERFVWFGWTNYDGTSTGLGRLDLTVFTESIETGARVPAYASDLMVTAQGNVLSVVTFQSIRVFAISGSGVWAEDTLKVASGTIDTGLIGYGIPDLKTAMLCDVRTSSLAGSYTVSMAVDGGSFTQIGSESTAGDLGTEFPAGEVLGERFELRFVLTRDGSATTTGPTITRYTLKSIVGAHDGAAEFIYLPLLLHSEVETNSGPYTYNVGEEVTLLKALHTSAEVITVQETTASYSGVIEDFLWIPYGYRKDPMLGSYLYPDGTFILAFKRIG